MGIEAVAVAVGDLDDDSDPRSRSTSMPPDIEAVTGWSSAAKATTASEPGVEELMNFLPVG